MSLGGLVFGTLLGPEATGLVWAGRGFWLLFLFVPGLFVSGFLAAPIAWFVVVLLWNGRRVGCVVWGCCLRTT